MDNYENKEHYEEKDHCECKKYFLIAFMSFLGAFLAFYVLMHQVVIHHLFNPLHHFERQEKIAFSNMDKDFKKLQNFEHKQMHHFNNKISAIQTVKNEDAYIIFVDLKKFNNNEKNINLNVENNTITISGTMEKTKKNQENAYFFTESFQVPEKIKTNEIKREKIDDKYIITIPIED